MKKNNITAVEWLAIRYHHRQGYLSLEDIAKAKQMEKEQIEKAFSIGNDCGYEFAKTEDTQEFNSAEQYYHKKYKNENNK